MSREGSTKIDKFHDPRAGVFVLGCGHLSQIVKMHYFKIWSNPGWRQGNNDQGRVYQNAEVQGVAVLLNSHTVKLLYSQSRADNVSSNDFGAGVLLVYSERMPRVTASRCGKLKKKKRPMGHIAHLRKTVQIIKQIWIYHNIDSENKEKNENLLFFI